MREIKAGYPRNRVHISFEGDDWFLRHPAVEEYKLYPGYADIKLRASPTLDEDSQALLASAIGRARIGRFEVIEPTLEEIFIEKVKQTSPGANGSGVATELSVRAQLDEPTRRELDA